MNERNSSSPAVLALRSIRKGFDIPGRRIEVLRGLDLEVTASRSVSLRGASGSGKSTLLNIASGLETPDSGEVRVDGQDLFSLPPRERSRIRATRIGFVFQSHHLIPEMNVLENVLFPARIGKQMNARIREHAIELLDRVGLADRVAQRTDLLSGGERQRVAVARALLLSPAILLADEPTGNLDERTGERVMNLFLSLVRETNTALLLVTHNPIFAAQTDQSWQIHDGVLNH